MQNSPGLPLVALAVALVLAAITVASVIAGTGADPALTELQIGATAWALALGIYGVQGVVSIVAEGRRLVPGAVEPRMNNPMSVAIAGVSMVLLVAAALTGWAIVSGQSTALIGSAAGAGCLLLGLLLLFYKEAFIGHEAHLEPRQDGVPW
jgi:hypothetical protein